MGPTDKRELLSRAFAATRFTRILELLPQRRVLIVLTYHRIGDPLSTPYDSGVFSATADDLDAHMRHLKRRFHMLTPEEAVATARGDGPARASVLITFDDGYLDNYTIAFPVLRSHGVSAMFFLATGFVGSSRVPWWDRIAYLIKQCPERTIRDIVFADVSKLYGAKIAAVRGPVTLRNYWQRTPVTLFGMDTMNNIVLFYLMISPCGAALSVDRWLQVRKLTTSPRV